MARDHRKLRVFHDAHQLTLAIYQRTRQFPKDEWFGLRAQLRRAAVSIPTNVVEGSARRSTREYFSFLNIARGSAGELLYLVGLAIELELLPKSDGAGLVRAATQVVKQLETLVQQVELLSAIESQGRRAADLRPEVGPKAQSPKPRA